MLFIMSFLSQSDVQFFIRLLLNETNDRYPIFGLLSQFSQVFW